MKVMQQSVAVSVILCPVVFTMMAAIWNDVPNADRDWFPVDVRKDRVGISAGKNYHLSCKVRDIFYNKRGSKAYSKNELVGLPRSSERGHCLSMVNLQKTGWERVC
jgi:hypothetical protein